MITLKRYLLTLVALLTMTTGAWADPQEELLTTVTPTGKTTYSQSPEGVVTVTLNNIQGYMAQYGWVWGGSVTVEASEGYTITRCVFRQNAKTPLEDDLKPFTATIDANEGRVTAETSTGSKWAVMDGITSIEVYGRKSAPVISDDQTSAEFEMPSYDATLEYDIVRNLGSNMSLNLFIGENPVTADARLRIKKESGVYVPVSPLTFTLTDATEQTELTAQQALAAKLNPVFELKGEGDTWTVVENINAETHLPQNLAPDQTYRVTLVAADDAPLYGGQLTAQYTVTLFEGYPVEVAAQSFVTYYQNEALYVDESSTTGELYTIGSVTDTEAVLSSKLTVAPANTPLLVYNSSDETKIILLVPTTEPAQTLTVAPEFKGTLAPKTFTADEMAAADHYVLTASNQFWWVKNAGTIGANKCWLEISTSAPNNARAIVFGDVTEVKEVIGVKEVKDDSFYDLNGRKLQGTPTKKGIYILNGKKVVVK